MAERDGDNGYAELEQRRDETFAQLAKRIKELLESDPTADMRDNRNEALKLLAKIEPDSERDTKVLQLATLDNQLRRWAGAPNPQLHSGTLTSLHEEVDQYQQLLDDLGPEEANKDWV